MQFDRVPQLRFEIRDGQAVERTIQGVRRGAGRGLQAFVDVDGHVYFDYLTTDDQRLSALTRSVGSAKGRGQAHLPFYQSFSGAGRKSKVWCATPYLDDRTGAVVSEGVRLLELIVFGRVDDEVDLSHLSRKLGLIFTESFVAFYHVHGKNAPRPNHHRRVYGILPCENEEDGVRNARKDEMCAMHAFTEYCLWYGALRGTGASVCLPCRPHVVSAGGCVRWIANDSVVDQSAVSAFCGNGRYTLTYHRLLMQFALVYDSCVSSQRQYAPLFTAWSDVYSVSLYLLSLDLADMSVVGEHVPRVVTPWLHNHLSQKRPRSVAPLAVSYSLGDDCFGCRDDEIIGDCYQLVPVKSHGRRIFIADVLKDVDEPRYELSVWRSAAGVLETFFAGACYAKLFGGLSGHRRSHPGVDKVKIVSLINAPVGCTMESIISQFDGPTACEILNRVGDLPWMITFPNKLTQIYRTQLKDMHVPFVMEALDSWGELCLYLVGEERDPADMRNCYGSVDTCVSGVASRVGLMCASIDDEGAGSRFVRGIWATAAAHFTSGQIIQSSARFYCPTSSGGVRQIDHPAANKKILDMEARCNCGDYATICGGGYKLGYGERDIKDGECVCAGCAQGEVCHDCRYMRLSCCNCREDEREAEAAEYEKQLPDADGAGDSGTTSEEADEAGPNSLGRKK